MGTGRGWRIGRGVGIGATVATGTAGGGGATGAGGMGAGCTATGFGTRGFFGKLVQPATSVDLVKQWITHQLFSTFSAFEGSETRMIINPFLASGGVAL